MSAPAPLKAPEAKPLRPAKLEALAGLCRRFHVRTLDVFGSAATGRLEFARGRSLDDYLSDRMLRAAVERQFEIVGEAWYALRRYHPALAARIPELFKIVGFRNIIAPLCNEIERDKVWTNVEHHLPALRLLLEQLLAELGGP